MSDMYPRMLPYGDTAALVEFENEISPITLQKIRAFCAMLEEASLPGIVELVPAYRTVTIHYLPELLSYSALREAVLSALDAPKRLDKERRVWRIPVLYGGEFGPDIGFVADHASLTKEEVIRLHTSVEYPVYMLGFAPGFPYLGGMVQRLETQRLSEPRVRIEAGSVGIAGRQTGIYPLPSPGGWRLIGRTPLLLYDPRRERPILLDAGDSIRFYAISEETFKEISILAQAGTPCAEYDENGIRHTV